MTDIIHIKLFLNILFNLLDNVNILLRMAYSGYTKSKLVKVLGKHICLEAANKKIRVKL